MREELLQAAQEYLNEKEVALIARAYDFADKAHAGQKRGSGEPYINHPASVAMILVRLKQDVPTIVAALLHDVLEDTDVTPEQIKTAFGEEVLFLVEGVTKLTELKLSSREEVHAENMRKMFLAMAKDIRTVFIKLADRLHNMRTLEYIPKNKQIENAQETLDIYAPLAHRLGLGLIKWELEDLSFRYIHPKEFNEIREQVADKRKEREAYINDFVEQIKKMLKENSLKGEVTGRPKHFYSIYRKMQTQNLEFDQIFDLLAVRILLTSEQDCYTVLGFIHSHWKPIQGKIKDYIAMPKENMYQSLHTTVIGPGGKQIEIQIRTEDMHHTAEYGIAAHWVYKKADKTKAGKIRVKQKEKEYIEKLSWLRKFTEEAVADGKEFMDVLKTDVLFEEVYVFSPKGDIYSLPQGATPVDFAYLVHTEVGNHCIGAKVNGKIVQLDTELQNGDVLEILTRNDAKPNSDWLTFVKGNRTKAKIKAWITRQSKEEHLANGQQSLEAALKEFFLDLGELRRDKYLETVIKRYTFDNEDDLYVGIGHGDVAAKAVARYLYDLYREKHKVTAPLPEQDSITSSGRSKKTNAAGVSVAGMETIMIRLANCCHPLPGDAITGFVTMGYGITVHRVNCHNIQSNKERKIDVFWNNNQTHKYGTMIEVVGFDRVGIFKDLLNVIADKNTNVIEATAKKTGQGEFRSHITVEVTDLQHLLRILDALKKVKDVYDAYRKTV